MKPYKGRTWDSLVLGEEFVHSITITAAHLDEGAALINDYNPLHVDEEFASRSRFGSRILHGMMTSAILGGPMGMIFHGTALAYLEHSAKFLAPVRIGDTLTLHWTVSELIPKPKAGGGIVVADGRAVNQNGEVTAEAVGKLLVSSTLPQ